MKHILWILAGLPALTLAAGPMDGTWVVDPSSAKLPERPDVYVLDKGTYACKSCIPSYSIKADGTDQAVSGHAYYDTIAVKVVDPQSIRITAKKAGKISFSSTDTVSKDGKTMTQSFEDRSESTPVTGKGINTRIADGPAGAHAISGSWRATKLEGMSANGLRATVHTTDSDMTFEDNNGISYDAKFDGKQYPMKGDIGNTMVSVRRINDHAMEESDYQNGKLVSVTTVTVAADGKTAEFAMTDKREGADGSTTKYTLHKQN